MICSIIGSEFKKVKSYETRLLRSLGSKQKRYLRRYKKSLPSPGSSISPDVNQGDSNAAEKFKEINEAYQVLSDEQKRATYDRFGHSAFEGANQGNYGDLEQILTPLLIFLTLAIFLTSSLVEELSIVESAAPKQRKGRT